MLADRSYQFLQKLRFICHYASRDGDNGKRASIVLRYRKSKQYAAELLFVQQTRANN